MAIEMNPIGYVRTDVKKLPRHWSISDAEGTLEIDEKYRDGLTDIEAGQRIIVLFNFHQSSPFNDSYLRMTPPHRSREMGVFSICSPIRPNPIGLSVVEVLAAEGTTLRVRHIDMRDGTPILDIKPYIEGRHDCPSYTEPETPSS
ncbi:tRNA (N6-threonylcarbamoyladenosine(37)-N6)-meth yltransferase TrmO [Desulfonema ishimotonii]|uniref:tRNA (N6-threonylcarbamoyladenosine(37)-N6)-meth yltransferase TrmO n=1 Tax=Desulfonema ishimotonii TaxID=45657 RepID=A0A401FWI4_9BACT|nr:tRNA (N6-threonylcarbamoyladenosine(37)-N6)-methyltransferase TrmO [Desulfonema ishimotonii]GBC61337.1 tRNA (N6-threonylcarbamoyladenosine(37)-N6)-meth yltransferase TrmO [Desulfonema ishimotonii]